MADINFTVDPKDVQELKKLVDSLNTGRKELNKSLSETATTQKEVDKAAKEAAAAEKKALKERESAVKSLERQRTAAYKKQFEQQQKTTKEYQKANIASQKAIKDAKAEAIAEGTATDSLIRKRQALIKAKEEYIKMSSAARKQAAPAIKKLSNEIESEEKAIGVASRGVGKYSDALSALKGPISVLPGPIGSAVISIQNMTKAAIAFIATPIGAAIAALVAAFGLIGSSIKKSAEFEAQMDKVAAITGATADEMDRLSDSAKHLGSTTSKTAVEVGQLQEEFSKLGFSTAEILAATQATLNLSIATGSDLAQSAKVAAATLNGFGLDASETQRVVDVMAKSFSSSALDMSKFETAMAQVAPAAKTTGISIERATAMLGTLVDSGLDASTAGTSLRNMLLQNAKAGRTFEEGLNELATSTNKNATAMELYGTRGAIASIVLADNTVKTLELSEAFDKASGSAKEMADVMEDNLKGDIKGFKSAWEGLLLSIEDGQGIFSKLSRFVVKTLTANFKFWKNVINGVSDAWNSFTNIITYSVSVLSGRLEILYKRFSQLGDNVQIAILKVRKLFSGAEKSAELETQIQSLRDNITLLGEDIDNTKDGLSKLKVGGDDKTPLEVEAEKNKVAKAEIITQIDEIDEKEQESFEKSLKRIQDKVKAEREASDTIAELDRQGAYAEATLDAAADELEIEDAKKTEKVQKEKLDKTSLAAQATTEISNGIFAAGERQRDAEIAGIEEKLRLGIISEETAAKEKAKIQTKQAKADKRKSLFDIAINTATAIVKALPNAALAAYAALQGAISAGAVAATPIPAFDKGTKNFPGRGWVGEKRDEVVTLNGKSALVTEPTLFDSPKFRGMEVISGATTAKLKQSGQLDRFNFDDSRIVSEIRKQNKRPRRVDKVTPEGIVSTTQRNNKIITNLRKF